MKSPRSLLLFAAALVVVAVSVERGEAHKPITSKYSYNEDIFPILRDRCGRCHVAGGVAPMSLMTYTEAYPWAESLRAEVMTAHMPPWHAEDGIGAFKNHHQMTASEIEKILIWASGGTPAGNPLNEPPRVAVRHDWPSGTPDLVLQLPAPATLGANQAETRQEFILPTHTTEPKWIRAVDLLPGTPSIVRDAIIAVRPRPGNDSNSGENVVSMWVPGEDPVSRDRAAAFELPSGAELLVSIHYKKTYQYNGQEMTDRSSVGLYFSPEPAKAIRRLTIESPPVTPASGTQVTFSRTVQEDMQALALNAEPPLSNARLKVDLVRPDGVRTPVIVLAVRPDWNRRYWFAEPLAIPRGSRIEVVAILNGADPLLPPAASPLPPQVVDGTPVRVSLAVTR